MGNRREKADSLRDMIILCERAGNQYRHLAPYKAYKKMLKTQRYKPLI